MMSANKKILLFDIDGTLLDASGGGGLAFGNAFCSAFECEKDISHINFAGATDLRVVRQLMTECGLDPSPESEDHFFSHLPREMDRHLSVNPPTLFPGVRSLLNRLAASERFSLGLVTGNIEAGARVKLRHAGVEQYFSFGGFGCDHADRSEIVRLAIQRARNGRAGFLFGDTPSDIKAAHANGLEAIAVATGQFDVATLRASGADYVFKDFSQTDKVLEVVEGCFKGKKI